MAYFGNKFQAGPGYSRLALTCGLLLAGISAPLAQAADAAGLTPVISGVVPAPLTLVLQLPAEELVPFDGMVSFDKAGGPSVAILYPAANAGGLLAGILTHALVAGSLQNGEKSKMREKANEVLLPYQPILSEYKHQQLMQDASVKIGTQCSRKVIAAAASPVSGEVVVESHPVFSLTQDQSALVLNNLMVIRVANGTASYQNLVRVVSPLRAKEQAFKFWADDQGRNLKDESARLFAQSLDVALADWNDAEKKEQSFKTVRYLEGSVEKMERAQVVSEGCNQVVLRNLRGNLMAVPPLAGSTTGKQCDAIPTAAVLPVTLPSGPSLQ